MCELYMAEIRRNRRKSSIQPNQPNELHFCLIIVVGRLRYASFKLFISISKLK